MKDEDEPVDPQADISDTFGFSPSLQRALSNFAQFQNVKVFNTDRLVEALLPRYDYSQLFSSIQALALTRPTQRHDEPSNTAYSPEMTSPSEYYRTAEITITSFDDLHRGIQNLVQRNPTLALMWRGQRDAEWGMHSSLYRKLMTANGVSSPYKRHRRDEPYPTEAQMVLAERRILDVARREWRLDNLNALEIFARLQHFGAPTRLLDVTRNPYIGAWFAVEESSESEDSDARLFALATRPVVSQGRAQLAEALSQIKGAFANSYEPFWHDLSDEALAESNWGNGLIRRFWVPPLYEQRIMAQNGAFIVDGVPSTSTGTSAHFTPPGAATGSMKRWRKADALAAASIHTKVYSTSRRVTENKGVNYPPTFTFRITASGKRTIREVLERQFGYRRPTIYPDVEGLAHTIREQSDLFQDLDSE